MAESSTSMFSINRIPSLNEPRMSEREPLTDSPFLTNDYSVEVTLAGEDFDPEQASTILGVKPTKSGYKGESRAAHQDGAVWNTSFWSREISSRDDVTQCRDHHISCLIDDIEPHIDNLRKAGMERLYFYFTLTSSIGLLNIKLSPSTMSRLAGLDADLYISCFDCFNPNHAFWQDGAEVEADDTAS